MSQNNPVLGNLVGNEEYRDAIHIAIAPAIAAEELRPGQHIGFVDDARTLMGPVDRPIGIVDPFLTAKVQPGQRFWLCLYQGSITSLRHVWTHPAFKARTLEAKP